jgi:hypothetical protein
MFRTSFLALAFSGLLAGFAHDSLAGGVSLGSFKDGSPDGWAFLVGKEYPGAQGNFSVVKEPEGAASLEGAFGQGGAYVAIERKLEEPVPFSSLKLKVKTDALNSLTIRLVDGTGQVHQQTLALKPVSEWQAVEAKSFNGARHVFWGGANDGKWHEPLKGVSLLLEKSGLKEGAKSGGALFSDIVLND